MATTKRDKKEEADDVTKAQEALAAFDPSDVSTGVERGKAARALMGAASASDETTLRVAIFVREDDEGAHPSGAAEINGRTFGRGVPEPVSEAEEEAIKLSIRGSAIRFTFADRDVGRVAAAHASAEAEERRVRDTSSRVEGDMRAADTGSGGIVTTGAGSGAAPTPASTTTGTSR